MCVKALLAFRDSRNLSKLHLSRCSDSNNEGQSRKTRGAGASLRGMRTSCHKTCFVLVARCVMRMLVPRADPGNLN